MELTTLMLKRGRRQLPFELNVYDGVEQQLREAVRLVPQNAVAHNNLGRLLQNVKKDDAGAEHA